MHFLISSENAVLNKDGLYTMSNIEPKKYITKKPLVSLKSSSLSAVDELLKKEVESIICVVADKRSIPALISLLDDQDFDIRWIAAESLIRIGRGSIIPLLISIRDGKNFSYPRKAYHILHSLLTRSEKKALQPLLSTLSGISAEPTGAGIEASIALKRVFRYVN